MSFFDDKSKKVTKWNRNYCFLGTILYLAVFWILFALDVNITLKEAKNWSAFNLTNLWISFARVFLHLSFSHILHNSIMIAVGGMFVERKIGTFKCLLLLLAFSFVGGAMTVAGAWSFSWRGSSIVWFALYGYILVDYLFSFQKDRRNKTNIILGAIVLVVEYIRSGFFDNVDGSIGWGIVPYQLIYNVGHYVGFIVGVIFALTVCLTRLEVSKKEQ